MSRIIVLSAAAVVLFAVAIAYGGRSSGATPLDGTQAYVTVINGCFGCGQGSFGAIEVAALSPADVRLADAELTSGSQVFTMTLTAHQEVTSCLLESFADGYTGFDFIHTPGDILMGNPTSDSLHLRLHYRSADGDDWATVPVIDVCHAVS